MPHVQSLKAKKKKKIECLGSIPSYIWDYRIFGMLLIYTQNEKKTIEIDIIYNILLVYLEKIAFISSRRLIQT